jgi:hypothetical protein
VTLIPIFAQFKPSILNQPPPKGKGKKMFADTGISTKLAFPLVLGNEILYGQGRTFLKLVYKGEDTKDES